jgi:hypothetical protein
MLAIPRIGDSGESIFGYEYLRKFKANIFLVFLSGTYAHRSKEKKSKIHLVAL